MEEEKGQDDEWVGKRGGEKRMGEISRKQCHRLRQMRRWREGS